MNESFLRNHRRRTAANLLTAVCFSLLVLYQSYLYMHIEASRFGRMLGIVSFLFLAAASVLAMFPRSVFSMLRGVLMVAGLGLNFALKLLNFHVIFSNLNFDVMPSVLNCGIYAFQQSAELILLFYYVVFRHNRKLNSKRKFAVALMSFVIVLYAVSLVMECVLITKYHTNIDLSPQYTFASRFLYFFGYVSIAVNFMLPVPREQEMDELMDELPVEDELRFSVPDEERAHIEAAPLQDDDFLLPGAGSEKEPSNKEQGSRKKHPKKLPKNYDGDFIL